MTKARHAIEDAMTAELGMSFHRVKILLDAYRDEVIDAVIDRTALWTPESKKQELTKQCKDWIA